MRNIAQTHTNTAPPFLNQRVSMLTPVLSDTRWQTWLVTICTDKNSSVQNSRDKIDIISIEDNKARTIKQIYPPPHKPSYNRDSTICTATYSNTDLFTCLPGKYPVRRNDRNTADALLNNVEKLSAFLEEALWHNLFQRLAIVCSRPKRKQVRATLSSPVQARLIAFYDL